MIELWKRLKKLWVKALLPLVFSYVWLWSSSVRATDNSNGNIADYMKSIITALLALLFVIFVIIGAAKLIKFLNKHAGTMLKSEHVEVIESLSVSPTLRLHLIRIKDIIYVIAENTHSIEVLKTFDGAEIPTNPELKSTFQEILRNKWKGVNQKNR